MNKTKKPRIRFKGFTDDWEQRKLLDMSERICVGFVGTCEQYYTDSTGIPMYRTGNLNGLYLNKDDLKYVTQEFHNKNMKSQLKRGDILIARHGDSGKAVIYNYSDEANCLNIVIIRPNSNECDYRFLAQCINSPMPSKQIKGLSAGSTQSVINTKEIEKLVVSVPRNVEEQKVLANFLFNLDNDIALHQRMSDKQKELKANLLQMMFPRNGEKIPEVRLAGFAEDWSQRTLEDISDKVTEKNKAREFTETLTNSAEYGIISQSDYFDKDISNINNIDGYYVVRPDDFVYNPRISNFAPVGPIKRNNLNRIGIMSPLYYVFRPKRVDHTFLEKYFETSYWHIFMKMNGDSGARADRFAIKDTILKEMPIPYPIKEEQVKIGIFFNQLDKSIVLHQEKIAHLKVLKSTLLNKMFI